MDRRDVAIVGVVALVTAACWTSSIGYDTGGREAESYSAGQRWAQLHEPSPAECEAEILRIAGPEVIGVVWMAGCLAPPPS